MFSAVYPTAILSAFIVIILWAIATEFHFSFVIGKKGNDGDYDQIYTNKKQHTVQCINEAMVSFACCYYRCSQMSAGSIFLHCHTNLMRTLKSVK